MTSESEIDPQDLMLEASHVPEASAESPLESSAEPVAESKEPSADAHAAGGLVRFLLSDLNRQRPLSVAVGGMLDVRLLYKEVLQQFAEAVDRATNEERLALLKLAVAADKTLPSPDEVDLDSVWLHLFEFVVQSVGHSASVSDLTRDERSQLVGRNVPRLLDWLEQRWDAEAAERGTEQERRLAAFEQVRRAREIPFPLPFDAEERSLPRDETLLLVGHESLTQWYCRRLLQHVATQKPLFTIAYLRSSPLDNRDLVTEDGKLIALSQDRWHKACDTSDGFKNLIFGHLVPKLTAPVDLIVVDDLRQLTSDDKRTDAARCNDAHRRMKQLCRDLGAAVVGFVPLTTETPPDLGGLAWESLRQHATLRPLWSERSNELEIQVKVGRDVHVAQLAPSALRRSPLTLPEGTR